MSQAINELEEPIFWLDFNPTETPFGDFTIALVSEIDGGIIAYYSKEDMAQEACNSQNEIVRLLKLVNKSPTIFIEE